MSATATTHVPIKAPATATNAFDWQQHRTAAPELLAIPTIPPAVTEIEADEHVSPAAVTNPFVGLTGRAGPTAANDGGAEPDADSPVCRGDANARMRRTIAARLVRARTLSGLTQGRVARLLSYRTPAQLNQWEQSRRLAPISELVRVAEVLGVSVDFLVGSSDEPERDPAAGLRNAVLKGVRKQLERVAEITVDEVSRHARLVGTDSGSAGQFIEAGGELLDAVRGLERLNPGRMDDMRGGATLARRLHEFENALLGAKRRQRLALALDADLRERLGRLPDGDIEFDLDDEPVGDDEA